MALISVIMPVYNSLNFVKESVNSVLAQSHKEFELLIIDDASTDGTGLLLRKIQKNDSRIKIISLLKNCGVSNARNIGIDHARGIFIAFLDSDDIWEKNKIEIQLSFMQSKNVKFTYTEYQYFKRSPRGIDLKGKRYPPKKLSYDDLISNGNPIGTSTTMIYRDSIGNLRFRDVGHEDFLFWLNILKTEKLEAFRVDLPYTMVFYQLHEGSLSSSKVNAIKWFWNILYNEEKLSFPVALWVFIKYCIGGIYIRLR